MFASLYCMILAISSRLTSPWITPEQKNRRVSSYRWPIALPRRNTPPRHQRVAAFEFIVACWAKPQKMQQVLRTCQRQHSVTRNQREPLIHRVSAATASFSLCSNCHLGSVRPVLKMYRLTPHTAEIGTGKEIGVFSQFVRADRPQHHPQIADAKI